MKLPETFALFYLRIVEDVRITPTHISLYVGLFRLWQLNGFEQPVSIVRREVMGLAKISSSATYHKCLKDLVAFNYLKYEPSFNPALKSKVYLR